MPEHPGELARLEHAFAVVVPRCQHRAFNSFLVDSATGLDERRRRQTVNAVPATRFEDWGAQRAGVGAEKVGRLEDVVYAGTSRFAPDEREAGAVAPQRPDVTVVLLLIAERV